MHKNQFWGRALPGPAERAYRLPRPLAELRGELQAKGREACKGKERGTGKGEDK